MTNAENTTARGLILTVLRRADGADCTLNGLSSHTAELTLIGVIDSRKGHGEFVHPLPALSRVVGPQESRPAVALEVRTGFTAESRYLALVPVELDAEWNSYRRAASWSMAGGNYATSSDSRFSELVETLTGARFNAVAIHDRVEH
ncbi:hypothetical protein GS504_03195 [Rhodococcus hoagii]|nr:hypothetical protein [Prescottella equi]